MSTSLSSLTDATFRVGGLASGMDTNTIIEKLVALESTPLTQLQTQQSNFKTQLSILGNLVSRLGAVSTAAADLGTNGVLAAVSSTTNTAFSATPGTNAVAGRYSVQVNQLALASKWRSTGFAAGATHPEGTLQLTVAGTTYDPITVQAGASLADVAAAIRAQGAPVSAVVLNDGTNSYLSITATNTGLPASGAALNVAFTPTVPGPPPVYTETQAARNATLIVDGLTFSRASNTITDIVPGTTLTLQKETGVAEDLVLSNDPTATQARLQKFVDAYNGVMALLQQQLHPSKDTDRAKTLTGDGALRSLQGKLQALLVTEVGTTTVRTFADLGVKTAKDGSLSIDATLLQKAMARDPASVNALFSTSGTGLAAAVKSLVDLQTRAGDGILVADQAGLQDRVSALDDQAAQLQARIDKYRQTLVAQFTAMETTVSGLKSLANFLTTQSSFATSNGR